MLSLSRIRSRSGPYINTWVVLECTLSGLCEDRSLRLRPIHFERWNHHILNYSTAVNTPILIIDRVLNKSDLVLMIYELSIVSWLLLYKHIAVAFIENLGVRVEHEAFIVGVWVARNGEAPASIAHQHEKRGIRETYCLLWNVLFTPLRLQAWFRCRLFRAALSMKLRLRTDSLRCQVHFRRCAHWLGCSDRLLRPPWVTQMIRIVIQWSRIPALIVRLLPRVIVRVDSRVIILIVPSFASLLFGFVAFLGYPTRREAVIPRSDTRWTITYRYLSLPSKLRTASWRALLLSATHITVLFHTLSALGSWLSTHSISLIKYARCGKSVAKFTRKIIFVMPFLILFLPTICRIATPPSTALTLYIEAGTWFELAIAKCVLWRRASSTLL